MDSDTWQQQLDELVALQSIYGEDDFRVLSAPSDQPPAAGAGASTTDAVQYDTPSACGAEEPLDLDQLMAAGPPAAVLDPGAGGWPHHLFVAEALIHVDIPKGGLQLMLEKLAPPPPAPKPKAPPPCTQPPQLLQQQEQQQQQQQQQRQQAEERGGHGMQGGGQQGNGHACNGDPWAGGTSYGGRGRGMGRGKGEASGRGRGRGGRGGGHAGVVDPGGQWEGGWPGVGPHRNGAAEAGGGRGGEGGGGRGRGRGGGSRGRGRGQKAWGMVVDSVEAAAAAADEVVGLRVSNSGDRGAGRRGRSGRGRGSSRREDSEYGEAQANGQAPLGCNTVRAEEGAGGDQHLHVNPQPNEDHASRDAVLANSTEAPLRPDVPAAAAAAAAGAGSRIGTGAAEGAPAGDSQTDTSPEPFMEGHGGDPAAVGDGGGSGGGGGDSDGGNGGGGGSQLTPFGPPLSHLSPLRVTMALGPRYPSEEPPAVELQALWLSKAHATSLAAALAKCWEEQGPGAPITFTWLDWLKSSALEHLGVNTHLVVPSSGPGAGAGAGAGGAAGGAGAGGGGCGPEQVAVALLRYSARREQQVFNDSNVRCPICFDDFLGARCVRLPECGDVFCTSCLATHLRTQLGSGAVDNLRCPAPACRRQLPPLALQQLLTPAEYERWEALTLQRTLDRMEDLVYCPRCREPCLEDKDHCTLCPNCFFSFCALCEESWHPGTPCLDAEARLALLEARRNRGEDSGEGGRSATERARKHLDKVNELKSLALLSTTSKQCPTCGMGVEKVEGCNKMTCGYCGAFFCWACSAVISGYDHFGEGKCVLFSQEEVDRWNAMYNGWAPRARPGLAEGAVLANYVRRGGRGEGALQALQVRLCRCVVCGQENVKQGGNNNVRCWACNCHFCYLCRTWLRNKPGAHFGPGRCKQHSED